MESTELKRYKDTQGRQKESCLLSHWQQRGNSISVLIVEN